MKPKIPNQKKLYAELKKRLDAYTLLIDGVYNSLNDDAARLALSTGYSGGVPFRWKDYPKTEELLLDLRTRFVKEMRAVVHASTSKEWEKSNEAQDAIANGALKCYKMKQGDKQRKYYRNNSAALEAFQKRRIAGLNLSQRLWNQSADYQNGLEAAISVGIEKGMSAVTLSKRLSQYLNDYPKLRKDYKELYGTATDIRDCEYNSARLARNEINMAYRSAEQERWKQFDFIVGKRIKTSSVHPDRMPHGDICDTLVGDYPKDFEWSGWHPQCYPSDTYVLTRNGWKLINHVRSTDLIVSLNPQTRKTEYTSIIAKQAYPFRGNLVSFKSYNLDCLVTPDHRIVYLGSDNKIAYKTAQRFSEKDGMFIISQDYVDLHHYQSSCVSSFVKSFVPYDGMVYDLTLERNHIMYIMRNGKCFWGSNCMCFEVPIMKTDDEFWNEDEDFKSENEVEDVPDNFKEWVKDNQDRIEAAEQRGTQPYFVRDNKSTVNDILGVNDKPTAQDVAKHNK